MEQLNSGTFFIRVRSSSGFHPLFLPTFVWEGLQGVSWQRPKHRLCNVMPRPAGIYLMKNKQIKLKPSSRQYNKVTTTPPPLWTSRVHFWLVIGLGIKPKPPPAPLFGSFPIWLLPWPYITQPSSQVESLCSDHSPGHGCAFQASILQLLAVIREGTELHFHNDQSIKKKCN